MPTTQTAHRPELDDWSFIYGRWRVHHHRLVARLAGSNEWQDFEGTSEFRPLMDGAGNPHERLE